MTDLEFNRQAAKKLAKERGFDPEEMLVCVDCGRTVIRKQNTVNPGRKDSIFCTCDSAGLPFAPVVKNND